MKKDINLVITGSRKRREPVASIEEAAKLKITGPDLGLGPFKPRTFAQIREDMVKTMLERIPNTTIYPTSVMGTLIDAIVLQHEALETEMCRIANTVYLPVITVKGDVSPESIKRIEEFRKSTGVTTPIIMEPVTYVFCDQCSTRHEAPACTRF